ncbi:MAG TPA: glycosyltransferase family 2 protein [Candidatus Binatia bacterium]|nr:glycosyltransferase family 2 protein [Candidatus Binatia bacterium]
MQRQVPLSVLVAAKNEERNIGRCLQALQWAEQVVVVDSSSTDRTARIASEMGREVVQFAYAGSYPKKRQWALDHVAWRHPWVLLLDADEEVTPALAEEIARVLDRVDRVGYFVLKQFHFLGRRLRFGGFSHSALILLRRGGARFEAVTGSDASGLDMEVHERLIVGGATARLAQPLVHHDFKGLAAYVDRHNRYSTWEAHVRRQMKRGVHGEDRVRARPWGDVQERRRFLKRIAMSLPFEPWLWFCYHYVLRLGFLDGRRGLVAAQLRRAYIEQVRAKLYEMQLAEGR